MSTKERRRLAVFGQVKPGGLTLRQASRSLDLSYRQTRRMFARFKAQGDAGLVHKLPGGAGNRRAGAGRRDRSVALYREPGELTVRWKGQTVASRALARRPAAASNRLTLTDRLANHAGPWRPPSHHPWKRSVATPPPG